MARDISELGADVYDDTPKPQHKISPKKRNYIIGLSITAFLLAGAAVGAVIACNTALSDYSNVENVTYYFAPKDMLEEGEKPYAVLYSLKTDKKYPSTFRIPTQIKGYPVVGVAEGAFSGHSEIEKVIMTNNITFIKEKAFYNCSNLESFTWSKNLTSVGVDAFGNTKFYNNLLKDTTTLYDLPSGLLIYVGKDYFHANTALVSDELTEAEINNIKTTYGAQETFKFSDLKIKNFCSGAFMNNDKIVYVDLPEGITEIARSTFESCTHLRAFDGTHSEVTHINERAFANCNNLVNIKLPNNLEYVGERAFSNVGLVGEIPDLTTVTYIGEAVFADCKNLTSITYNGLTVPDYTFSGCGNLSTIRWGTDDANIDLITNIGMGAFEGTGFVTFYVPKNLTSINDETFKNCQSLKKVGLYGDGQYVVPEPDEDGNQEDPYYEGVRTIKSSAFENCTSLDTIVLFDNDYLDKAGYAEEGTFYFPRSLLKTDAASTISGNDNKVFANSAVKKVVVPSGLTNIGSYAFYKCENLEEVVFPADSELGNIKNNAFAGCTSLTTITIPTSVITIGASAFRDCTALTAIDLTGVEISTISAYLVYGCENLTSFTIPTTVKNIKENAFYHNYSLDEVVIDTNITSITNGAFSQMRRSGEGKMPIYFNRTYVNANSAINFKIDNFCDSTIKKFYNKTCDIYFLIGDELEHPENIPWELAEDDETRVAKFKYYKIEAGSRVVVDVTVPQADPNE